MTDTHVLHQTIRRLSRLMKNESSSETKQQRRKKKEQGKKKLKVKQEHKANPPAHTNKKETASKKDVNTIAATTTPTTAKQGDDTEATTEATCPYCAKHGLLPHLTFFPNQPCYAYMMRNPGEKDNWNRYRIVMAIKHYLLRNPSWTQEDFPSEYQDEAEKIIGNRENMNDKTQGSNWKMVTGPKEKRTRKENKGTTDVAALTSTPEPPSHDKNQSNMSSQYSIFAESDSSDSDSD